MMIRRMWERVEEKKRRKERMKERGIMRPEGRGLNTGQKEKVT